MSSLSPMRDGPVQEKENAAGDEPAEVQRTALEQRNTMERAAAIRKSMRGSSGEAPPAGRSIGLPRSGSSAGRSLQLPRSELELPTDEPAEVQRTALEQRNTMERAAAMLESMRRSSAEAPPAGQSIGLPRSGSS